MDAGASFLTPEGIQGRLQMTGCIVTCFTRATETHEKETEAEEEEGRVDFW